jgi:dipeptidyl aminopeptidase/acylaminoacyl peptidase
VRWDADSSRFTFVFNQRGHQALRILAVDAGSGAVQPIVDEESKTFIDYSGKYFAEYLDDTGEIIWMSERDGWNHLYLYDAKTGALKNQITKGQWVVRSVDYVDRANRQIWFQAGGVMPGQDPYFLHFCRVNFDGTDFTVLTAGDGTHVAQFSPDRKFLLDTWSRVDAPPATELRRGADGGLVCRLETAVVTGPVPQPRPFVAKGRDGATDIYGVLWFPKDFNPHKRYPVLEDIYAGPQDSFTPKSFHTTYSQQRLADDGFIVAQLDGMGTANRSKAFHDVCWKNLRDAGFPDRLLWLRAAAKKFPAMDLARAGIYGTSAGGQDALRGLLDHGDFYQAGVADSGCYDNRMDKIWWNEQWMGWPVDDSYTRSSCVTDAHQLRGQLLLMAGEMDKNVDPASTMQVVNALVKAGRNFELLIMPGQGHGVLSTEYGKRRLEDFFKRTLGGPK